LNTLELKKCFAAMGHGLPAGTHALQLLEMVTECAIRGVVLLNRLNPINLGFQGP
jgi:hypothetical protein